MACQPPDEQHLALPPSPFALLGAEDWPSVRRLEPRAPERAHRLARLALPPFAETRPEHPVFCLFVVFGRPRAPLEREGRARLAPPPLVGRPLGPPRRVVLAAGDAGLAPRLGVRRAAQLCVRQVCTGRARLSHVLASPPRTQGSPPPFPRLCRNTFRDNAPRASLSLFSHSRADLILRSHSSLSSLLYLAVGPASLRFFPPGPPGRYLCYHLVAIEIETRNSLQACPPVSSATATPFRCFSALAPQPHLDLTDGTQTSFHTLYKHNEVGEPRSPGDDLSDRPRGRHILDLVRLVIAAEPRRHGLLHDPRVRERALRGPVEDLAHAEEPREDDPHEDDADGDGGVVERVNVDWLVDGGDAETVRWTRDGGEKERCEWRGGRGRRWPG